MLLKEMMEQSGLTRKQLEIIQKKGFLNPKRDANGYRLYTEDDLALIRRITFLRKFGLSLDECFALLIQKDAACVVHRRKQIQAEQYRLDTALQYLDLLEKPQGETPDIEGMMCTFELYDQISAGKKERKSSGWNRKSALPASALTGSGNGWSPPVCFWQLRAPLKRSGFGSHWPYCS